MSEKLTNANSFENPTYAQSFYRRKKNEALHKPGTHKTKLCTHPDVVHVYSRQKRNKK